MIRDVTLEEFEALPAPPACTPWCQAEHDHPWDADEGRVCNDGPPAGWIEVGHRCVNEVGSVLIESTDFDVRVERWASLLHDADGPDLRVDQPEIRILGEWAATAVQARTLANLLNAAASLLEGSVAA